MNFAKKILTKYGWQEGQGIGKNADGIVKPIKVDLKFDNAGLCFDKAGEFTNHWWERAFNSAADNLSVQNHSNNVSLSLKDNESIKISASGVLVRGSQDGKKKGYEGYFQQSRTEDDQSLSDDQVGTGGNSIYSNINKVLTDDDILKACGGRTAHKGARHGLSLSGKLSRINAQEEQLLETNILTAETAQNVFKTWVQVKRKHKNRRQTKSTEKISCDLLNQEDYQSQYTSKKKKKELRNRDEELAKSLSSLSTSETWSSAQVYAMQSTSKVIMKEKRKCKHSKHSTKKIHEKLENATGQPKEAFHLRTNYSSGESDSQDEQKDPLVKKIAEVMKKYPNRKFKVIAEELTPLQKKHLQKSGLKIKLKSKKDDKRKKLKELAQIKKISRDIEKSMKI